jgi:hypothetical protein
VKFVVGQRGDDGFTGSFDECWFVNATTDRVQIRAQYNVARSKVGISLGFVFAAFGLK